MPDKVQREIEELLDKLDNFVPEERFTTKMRDRKRRERPAPSSGPPFWESVGRRVSGITLGHVMLAGLACLVVGFVLRDSDYARWLSIAGLLLTAAAFILSIMNKGSGSRTPLFRTGGSRVQKRWRGQIIEYGEPSAIDRLRQWFRRRGRS
jgi:hypothetical protein